MAEIPSSAVAAALTAWEEHGQAGASPQECMEAALKVAVTSLAACPFGPLPAELVARGWRDVVMVAPVSIDPHGNLGRHDTSLMIGASWWERGGAVFLPAQEEGAEKKAAATAETSAADRRWGLLHEAIHGGLADCDETGADGSRCGSCLGCRIKEEVGEHD